MRRDADMAVYVECEECLTAYWDPQDLGSSFRSEDIPWSSTAADRSTIAGRGWSEWIGYALDGT